MYMYVTCVSSVYMYMCVFAYDHLNVQYQGLSLFEEILEICTTCHNLYVSFLNSYMYMYICMYVCVMYI